MGKEKLPLQLKPPMDDRIKQLRLEFAQKWLGIGEDKLGNIIWTDETMISQLPTKQRAKEWMQARTPVRDRAVQAKKHSDGFKVMFSFGPLKSIIGTVDADCYLEILKSGHSILTAASNIMKSKH